MTDNLLMGIQSLIIFYSLSSLFRDTSLNNYILCFSILLLLIKWYKSKLKIPRYVLLNFYSMLILISLLILKLEISLIDYKEIILSERFILNLFYIFLIYCIFDYKKFYEIMEKVFIMISALSLISYFLANIFLSFRNSYLIGPNIYRHIYIHGYTLGRHNQNASIFWEPSVYGIILSFFLFFRSLKNPTLNPKKDFIKYIFILSILTTRSTSGLVMLVIIIFYTLIKLKYSIKNFVIFLVCLVFFLNTSLFKKTIYNKLKNISNERSIYQGEDGTRSSGARKMHFLIDFEIFKKNLLIGDKEITNQQSINSRFKEAKELSKKNKYILYYLENKTEYHITSNSIVSMLAYFGIIFFLVYYLIFFKYLYYKINLDSIIFTLILVIAFSSQYIFGELYFIYLWFLPFNFLKKFKGE